MSRPILYLIIIGIFVAGAVWFFQAKREKNSGADISPGLSPVSEQNNELIIEDLSVGSGLQAQKWMTLTVHYRGTLSDGRIFDSSYNRGQPFSFVLGAGEVIKGWDQGLVGMKVGGKRKLVIPPELGYGDREVGGGLIPANSTLIFEVELLDVK